MSRLPGTARVLAAVNTQLERVMRLRGDRVGVEGSWSGNVTVPRMTLDLNRILLYGRADATLANHVQRRVLHIVDAVIAGQGHGPLAPLPLPLRVIMAGENALALDWVAAHLLGDDASRIPLLTLAFEEYRWPIAAFDPRRSDTGRLEEALWNRRLVDGCPTPVGTTSRGLKDAGPWIRPRHAETHSRCHLRRPFCAWRNPAPDDRAADTPGSQTLPRSPGVFSFRRYLVQASGGTGDPVRYSLFMDSADPTPRASCSPSPGGVAHTRSRCSRPASCTRIFSACPAARSRRCRCESAVDAGSSSPPGCSGCSGRLTPRRNSWSPIRKPPRPFVSRGRRRKDRGHSQRDRPGAASRRDSTPVAHHG